jgi:hypothetical protein
VNYEDFVSLRHHLFNSYSDLVRAEGIYSFSSFYQDGKLHCDDDTAYGWVDRAAHTSIQYYYLVNDKDGDWEYKWNYVAKKLTEYAVQLTAGFLKFFYDEVQKGKQVPYTAVSDCLSKGLYHSFQTPELARGKYTIVLTATEPNPDFDIYYEWDAHPTPSSYHGCSTSTDSLEYLTVEGEGKLGICVHCKYGSGDYEVQVYKGHPRWAEEVSGYIPSWSERTISKSYELQNGQTIGNVYLAGSATVNLNLLIRWGSVPSNYAYDDYSSTEYSLEQCSAPTDSGETTLYALIRSYSSSTYYRLLFLLF